MSAAVPAVIATIKGRGFFRCNDTNTPPTSPTANPIELFNMHSPTAAPFFDNNSFENGCSTGGAPGVDDDDDDDDIDDDDDEEPITIDDFKKVVGETTESHRPFFFA